MKLFRLLAAIALGLAATLAVLAWGAHATEAAGSVTTCDDAHFTTALAGGGLVTFNCGGAATLSAAAVHNIALSTTIDGSNNGQPLTLTAASGVRLFYIQSGATLTLTNVIFAGLNYGSGPIYVFQGGLVISHSQFISNATGAIYSNGPVTVTNSVFAPPWAARLFMSSRLARSASIIASSSATRPAPSPATPRRSSVILSSIPTPPWARPAAASTWKPPRDR